MREAHPATAIDRFFAQLTLRQKFLGLSVVIMIMFIASSWYNASLTRESQRDALRESAMNMVEAALHNLKQYKAQHPDELNQYIGEMLGGLRWGESLDGYVYAFSVDQKFVAFPPKPEWVGEPVPNIDLNEGGRFGDVATQWFRAGKSGFVTYQWRKPGKDELVDKTTYIEPWPEQGWIIASGIYLDDADELYQETLTRLVWVSIGVLVVMFAASHFVVNAMQRSFSRVVAAMENLARGNLTFHLDCIGRDEVSHISRAIESTRQSLAELIGKQMEISQSLSEESKELSSRMATAKRAIDDESSQLEQLSSAMEQMAATVREVAEHASTTSAATQATNERAATGNELVGDAVNVINNLSRNLDNCSKAVTDIANQVDTISSVTDSIESIAEQTNLLALNAAIEAARAGESGRGFAVVADEVRQLAMRSRDATGEINGTIEALKKQVQDAVELMSASVEVAETGSSKVGESGEMFDGIVTEMGEITNRSLQIATAAEQQGSVAGEMTANLAHVRDAVRDTEQVVSKLFDSSQNLSNRAAQLKEMVSNFKVA
ncbi:Methyl-accepting chemotaxis protein [Hahella chejuensis KCTC 2396]|uniref:Methyl-accepting chemotaxis protein n=1 Tax=Hahella chejuensis (strain KCTC 2396) TaxID=349521 RepID=Q2SE93_HAHCH|nr:methyl-accepting chemotaxis protein [Hahella chejuensis]ABC31031.1 Methyl-accepting chemotaxis protein [Hahella chejuensis KCTC 2396]